MTLGGGSERGPDTRFGFLGWDGNSPPPPGGGGLILGEKE